MKDLGRMENAGSYNSLFLILWNEEGIMIYYGVIFFLWLIAVILMSGKGGFLIAGYNTAPKEQKRKYDEKKLSRIYGIGMLIIALCVSLVYAMGEEKAEVLSRVMPVILIVTIIGMILAGSFLCRAPKEENPIGEVTAQGTKTGSGEVDKDEEKKNFGRFIPMLLIIAMLLLILPMLYLGEVKISYQETGFTVSVSGWKDKEIAYNEIVEIERMENFSVGSRTGGLGTAKLLAGNFHNDVLGDYELYAYQDSTEYVILYREGKTIVIGLESKEDADQLYEKLIGGVSGTVK